MSKLQTIVDYCLAELREISVANGYNLNVDKVNEWREMPQANKEDRIGINFRDVEISSEPLADTGEMRTITVEVEGYVRKGQATPTEARKVIEDVLAAMGSIEVYDDIVHDITLLDVSIEMEHNEKMDAVFVCRFGIEYLADRFEL
jgi:hypothetical protein